MVQVAPVRLPLASLAESPDHAAALFQLIDRGIIEPHSLPFPGAVTVGERPVVSPLVHALIAQGSPMLVTMDQRAVTLTEEPPRRLLALMDGTRSAADLAAMAAEIGFPPEIDITAGLRQFARAGLLALPPES